MLFGSGTLIHIIREAHGTALAGHVDVLWSGAVGEVLYIQYVQYMRFHIMPDLVGRSRDEGKTITYSIWLVQPLNNEWDG